MAACPVIEYEDLGSENEISEEYDEWTWADGN